MKIALDQETVALVQEAQRLIRAKYRADFRKRNELMLLGPWGVLEHGDAALQRRLRDCTYLMGEVNLAIQLRTPAARKARLKRLIAGVKTGRNPKVVP